MNKFFIQCTITLLISFNFLAGQTDTLNKLTPSGKKTGYWKVYLNENADPVENIENSFFYGIELYDNGERVFKYNRHTWSGTSLKFEGKLPQKGKPEPINGTFRWYDQKGFLHVSETYKNEQPLYIRSYHVLNNRSDTIDHLFEDLDFTVKYNNIPGTYYYKEHALLTNTYTEYWFRKGKKGWRVYKIKK